MLGCLWCLLFPLVVSDWFAAFVSVLFVQWVGIGVVWVLGFVCCLGFVCGIGCVDLLAVFVSYYGDLLIDD